MPWSTHDITNQTPPLTDYNLFDSDEVLKGLIQNSDAVWHLAELHRQGAYLGSKEVQHWGELANQYPPTLITFNPQGVRIDQIEFHPAWHHVMNLLRSAGLHALPWLEEHPGPMAARIASFYLHGQNEAGSLCPITMTCASIPVLAKEPSLFAYLREKLLARIYDERDQPIPAKRSLLIGMGMTEKQGGSDVRSNTTRAVPIADIGRGESYRLTGHKWFFSVPTSDAHLVLARTDDKDAPSCFFVPRYCPDDSKNAIHIQRLKDKVGNRSNASSEVELLDAYGAMVGEEGRGIPTIIEMATYTRLDCVAGSAALIRQALVQAIHHCRHRQAFGRLLSDQPLMRQVLADLALECEAATTLMMRLAAAFDHPDTMFERGLQRWLLPAAKYWVCKRAIEASAECMEILGGNGYVETSPLARLYREAPVNSIWEGSGNVMCLDVLRAYEREPEAAQAVVTWLQESAQGEPHMQQSLQGLLADLVLANEEREAAARRIAQNMVLLAQASLLKAQAPGMVAETFISTRLGGVGGRTFGILPGHLPIANAQRLIERAFPC